MTLGKQRLLSRYFFHISSVSVFSLLINRLIVLLDIAFAYVAVKIRRKSTFSDTPENILLFAYMGLGDAIMMLPMLRSIKETYPNAKLHALTQLPSPAHEILKLSGCVEMIEFFNFKQASLRERWKLLRKLTSQKFDIVLCSYLAPVPYFISLIRKIPIRVGHIAQKRGIRNLTYNFLWTHPVPVSDSDQSHETSRYLALSSALGIWSERHRTNIALEPIEAHIQRAKEYLQAKGVNENDICCGIHPAVGITMPWRQWGIDRLVETAERLRSQFATGGRTVRILLFGSNADKILLNEMASKLTPSAIILIPEQICSPDDVPLSMTMAFLHECTVVIANDGGIAHLATACGVSLVRIFGMSDYFGYKSLSLNNGVRNVDAWKGLKCSPCMGLGVIKPGLNLTNCGHLNCLRQITVDEVVQEATITVNGKINQEVSQSPI